MPSAYEAGPLTLPYQRLINVDHINTMALLQLLQDGVPLGQELGKCRLVCTETMLAIW